MPESTDAPTPAEPAWASQRLIALRGATSVEANEREAILSRTVELLEALMERNALQTTDIVSAIFTVTADLDAEFPAVAARQIGFDQVPLLCTQEIPVPGSLPKAVRILLHTYAPADHKARHVYLHEARALRADLEAAQ
ncbi:MAG: chorismate mutase [Solirubrobacteraceae bacterium]|nr:chorismate mutase [Solirubrobacteraceae bacterium]